MLDDSSQTKKNEEVSCFLGTPRSGVSHSRVWRGPPVILGGSSFVWLGIHSRLANKIECLTAEREIFIYCEPRCLDSRCTCRYCIAIFRKLNQFTSWCVCWWSEVQLRRLNVVHRVNYSLPIRQVVATIFLVFWNTWKPARFAHFFVGSNSFDRRRADVCAARRRASAEQRCTVFVKRWHF